MHHTDPHRYLIEKYKEFLAWVLFAIFSIGILSPIASNEYFPKSADYANHIVLISQAKKALDNNQNLPLRTAPDLYQRWNYPIYQFYSPLVYQVAGSIHKWVTPDNPWIAFKITIWFALIFAGIFTFRLTQCFVPSPTIALLTAVSYLMSPFLLVNINARGDFTESIALCILPCILYFCVKLHEKFSFLYFFLCAFAWCALAETHLVTFLFSSIFIGLFMLGIHWQSSVPISRLLALSLAYIFSWLLACWYLAPIILLEPYLYTHYVLNNPFTANWINPISTLLSPVAISPVPLPGNDKLSFPFYVGIGWPVLLAAGFAFYKLITEGIARIPTFIILLLALMMLAFFATWSPVDFWQYLPLAFCSLQFGYRLIIQIMWMGTLLFAWGINQLFDQQFTIRHFILGVLLIGAANGSWLMTNQSSHLTLKKLVEQPQLYEWGARSYVMNSINFHTQSQTITPVTKTEKNCQHKQNALLCQLTITQKSLVQLPALYYPAMLDVKVNGKSSKYQSLPLGKKPKEYWMINPMLLALNLKPGNYEVEVAFTGLAFANKISFGSLLLGLTGLLILIIHHLFFWWPRRSATSILKA